MVSRIIEELAALDIKIATDEGQLKISAPAGRLNARLQQQIRDNKDALVQRLVSLQTRHHDKNITSTIIAQPQTSNEPFPLSDLQLGFYMANDPYMEHHVRPHCYMELNHTSLNIATYEQAWNKALHRHQLSLYVVNADLQLEKLNALPTIKCQVNDLRALSPTQVEEQLLVIRQRLERQELPLDRWPWCELWVSVWRDAEGEQYRIHYNHNNFFIDGYATNQLLLEIDHYYLEPDFLPSARELSFKDAVMAINALEHSPRGQQAKQYWQQRLANLPAPPQLPQLSGVNRRTRSKLQRKEARLNPVQWQRFKQHASINKVTPSNAVIAAYAYVIATYSGSEHFILSQMVTRRFAELHPEIKSVLGNFASLYPLEIRLARTASFATNAVAIQQQVLADINQLYYGGMQVLQALNQLHGGFGEAPSPYVIGSGLFIKDYKKFDYVLLETSQTLLDHQFFELEDGTYVFVWDMLEEFFPEGVLESMFNTFERFLLTLSDNPETWLSGPGSFITPSILAQRSANNDLPLTLPYHLLHAPLAQQAITYPQGIAVVAEQTLRYDVLHHWSHDIAAQLIRLTNTRNAPVAVVMHRGGEMVAAMLGILKAGGAYVPIDPALPLARRTLLIEDVGANIVLTQAGLKDDADWSDNLTVLVIDYADAANPHVMPATTTVLQTNVLADDLAYIIYTSGTTGRPKGVMIEHKAAMNTIIDINTRFGVNQQDKIFALSAFNFDLSVYDIFGAMAAGATLVYPQVGGEYDPQHWMARIIEQGITIWNSVPALMSLLVEQASKRGMTLPSLRLVLLSGDKIATNLPAMIHQMAPNAEVISLGGATEASIWSILYPLSVGETFQSTVPYGYPMRNQSWHIKDQDGHDLPDYVVGELLIGGQGLARGYWADQAKTDHSFIIDAITGERLYRTGDLGRYRTDGCLEILGRIDFQVKIQGHRIELGEIEATLLALPSVAQAVVCVRESKNRESAQLLAYVVAATGHDVDSAALEMALQQKLPTYMIPVAYIALEALPRSRNGKVDRTALLALLPGNDDQQRTLAHDYEPAGNEHEQLLVEIWQRVLKVERIGITDDFFQLGGQSFDAIRIFTQIKEHFFTVFTLGDIWSARTIKLFAKKIQAQATVQSAQASVSLIELVANKRGREIFLVHPAGGTITPYIHLANQLARPVFALQAGWGHQPEAAFDDVKAIAAHYLDEVRKQQPGGPYTLGGWSSGGAIAFEMAYLLEKDGEQVDHVVMLDAPAPYEHQCLVNQKLISWFMEDLALALPLSLLDNIEFEYLSVEQQLTKAIDILQQGTTAPLVFDQLLPIYRVFINMVKLISDYQPDIANFKVSVVKVADNIVSEFAAHHSAQEDDWGWGSLTNGTVNTIVVPGDHHSFLAAENLSDVVGFVAEE